MTAHRYAVRKVSTRSLAKFGCVLGGVAMALPGILCAIVAVQIVAVLRTLLDTWQTAEADLLGLGAPLDLDFITLLGLDNLHGLIARLDDQRVVLALLIILGSVIGGGLVVALIILLVGWAYNLLAALSGGLEVELWE